MVLAERNSDSLRNGRRSQGPSPNGHASESTSGDENEGLPEEKIRVGRDYQTIVPEFIPLTDRRAEQCSERSLLVWSPSPNIPDLSLDEYISLAKEKYGYNGEQALGMLFWHKHDLERAIRDLANFTPFPDEWTIEDKVLFEQAFQFHGKSFHRIKQMLPDKSIPQLVKYYYSWKKTRTRTSLMDRQARKLASHREEGSEGGSEHGSNTDSDSEEKVKPSGNQSSTLDDNQGKSGTGDELNIPKSGGKSEGDNSAMRKGPHSSLLMTNKRRLLNKPLPKDKKPKVFRKAEDPVDPKSIEKVVLGNMDDL